MKVFDDVVIAGVGGYFPLAENIEEFQESLLSNKNLITTRWTEGLDGITNALGAFQHGRFDNGYFKILRTQAQYMDPMYFMALLRSYEALLDAGVNPVEIKGKRVGVFMGSANGESDDVLLDTTSPGYGLTGHSRAMLPNRISYWLDVKGPSMNISANWLSGLEALKIATQAIKDGHCDAAIVGGVNLAIHPNFQKLFHDFGVLSPDGTTKCYDEDANGIVRSDGVVMLYLQRASDAKRSYASIVKVDSLFNGNRNGPLIDIDLDTYSNFLEEFYRNTPVKPTDIEFVETYGCGIKKIDEIEVEGLERVFCKNRKDPLLIGSVKSNTGHAEAASSLFGLVKVLIAMETGTIPATINCKNLNSNISALKNGTVQVLRENREFSGEYAAVNAFGIDSYYGHILLKANTKNKMPIQDDIPRLVLAASRTETGIQEIIDIILNRVNVDVEYINLIQEFYSKPTPLHTCRGYVLKGETEAKKATAIYQGKKHPIWFVYSGMGSQWNGMLGDLMKISIFANAINKCHDILATKGLNLKEIISSKDPAVFDNILNSFVGIAAMQIGLTDVLKALDIVPDGIIGHSVGELGCAYADGCLTAEEMILAAYYRGRASLEATLIKGMMAAVGLGYNKMKDLVPPTIEVACHNGPDSCTISGPREDMEEFVKKLQNDGIFARLVNVANIAYHSRYIKPAAPILLKYLRELLPMPVARSSKWVSTSNKEENWNTELAKHSSAEYHTNNLLSSVLFEEAFVHVPKEAILIEIAPHGLLQAILKRSCKPGCINVQLTQRGIAKNVEFLLTAIGKLYLAGLNVNLPKLYPKITYPVGKGTYSLANLARWDFTHTFKLAVTSNSQAVVDLEVTPNSNEFRHCRDYQLNGQIVVPITTFLQMITNISFKLNSTTSAFILEDLIFVEPVILSEYTVVPVHAMMQKASGYFEILVGQKLVVSGRLTFPVPGQSFLLDDSSSQTEKPVTVLSEEDIYKTFEHKGHKYSGNYRRIKKIRADKERSVSLVNCENDWALIVEAMIQQHLLHDEKYTQDMFVPTRINKIAIDLKALQNQSSVETVEYNYLSNVCTAKGVNLLGLQTKAVPVKKNDVAIESNEFVPFEGSSFENMEIAIVCVLQTVLDNLRDRHSSHMTINELKCLNSSVLQHVNNVAKFFPNLNLNTNAVDSLNSIKFKSNLNQLVIYNDELTSELANSISSSDSFVLVRSSAAIKTHPTIIEVFQFNLKGVSYSLLRKTNTIRPLFINYNDSKLSIKDLSNDQSAIMFNLEKAISMSQKQQSNVYIVSNVVPIEGINNFAKTLASLSKYSQVRLLFILNTTPDITLNELFVKKVIERDLTLTVVKNNVIGTIISIPMELKTLKSSHELITNGIDIKYLGFNKDSGVNDSTLEDVINLNYSGIDQTGNQVMGVAKFNKKTSQLSVDPIFTWQIPDTYSLIESTTLPLAYICAYYCLVIKGKLKVGDTVLIHSGHTSIGFAAIAIASSYRCKVFTTVETKAQATYLKDRFHAMFNDLHIFSSTNHNFEPLLAAATRGKQANVVLNNLTGNFIETSCGCVGPLGTLVHIGEIQDGISIGMGMFQRQAKISVVNLKNIFKLSENTLNEIKTLIQKGLDGWSVKQLKYEMTSDFNYKNINESENDGVGYSQLTQLTEKSSLHNMFSQISNKFVCKQNKSYLVYGGNSDEWCNIVEWLVFREARKIVIANSEPTDTYINHRLAIFQQHFGVNVMFAPVNTETKSGIDNLISVINRIDPIDVALILPQSANNTENIVSVLLHQSPNATIVTLNSTYNDENACLNIQWDNDLSISDVTSCLDNVLNYRIRESFIRSKVTLLQNSTFWITQKLDSLLPTVATIVEEVQEAPTKPTLKQLTNLGPREIRELPPIFVIPGLTGHEELKEMTFNLTYPVYYVVLPASTLSIKELAEDIIKQMKEIYSGNVYNIVGLSWGGALMMEIAKLLDLEGASLHLFFIDSAPKTIKSAVNHLGNTENEFETNLLIKLFKIDDFKQRSSLLYAPSWNERVDLVLKNYENDTVDINVLKDALNTLKHRLYEVKNFSSSSDKLVPGKIHLIRPNDAEEFDNCGLVSYCQQVPKIRLVQGDHLSIARNKDTSFYINENHCVN